MPQTKAAEHMVSEIEALGEQTRLALQRYEAVFPALGEAMKGEIASHDNLADAALAVIAIADAAAAAFRTHFPNPPALACRAACDACCHLYVMVPPGMAEAMAAHLVARLEPSALVALKLDLQKAVDAAQSLPDPSKLHHRCPLLGADGLCTVYEVRPLTCRAFTSKSAAACRSLVFDPRSPIASIPQNPSHFAVYVEATKALEGAARTRGLPHHQRSLPAALLEVFASLDDDGI
jgi:Fe-S-cluster containining protein